MSEDHDRSLGAQRKDGAIRCEKLIGLAQEGDRRATGGFTGVLVAEDKVKVLVGAGAEG